jgi:serine/threonine-protein kinase
MDTYNCSACGHENEQSAKFCGNCGHDISELSVGSNRVGTTIVERYTIRRLIAVGGMGVVYEAEQLLGEHHRTVAIKMLRPELSHDEVVVSRFNRECGIVAQLSHQNTVQVFDFGAAEDGTLYIAMEYVRGQSLATLIGSGKIAVSRTLGIVEQMCNALHEAHELGIVHRDLKPDNVILTQHGPQPDFVKLLDFGIAVRLSAGGQHETKLTQQGIILGTPPYMSPEQFTGAPVTRQSDVYSLGIIIYEMLTGQLPFAADNPWTWAQRHLTSIPPDLPADIPTAIATTIRAALAKDPAQRPRTALEMYHSLTGEISVARQSVPPMSSVNSLDAELRAKTEPDAAALAVAEPPKQDPPIVKTDRAAPPIMTNGAPYFGGNSTPLPNAVDISGRFENKGYIAPSMATPPTRTVHRGRGPLVGVVLAIGLLLTLGGLLVAYWLGAISNPFESDESASPGASAAPGAQASVSLPNTQLEPELAPIPPAGSLDQKLPEPSNSRVKGTTHPGVPQHGSASPSANPAPSASASAAPGGFSWPPFMKGLPTSLPPMPTSIAGIPIPPIFPGMQTNPQPAASSEPAPAASE